jgi:Protein of unknown function (DUF3810)
MKNFTKKYFGIIAALFAFTIKCICSIFPFQLEQIYCNNIFELIRNVVDKSIGQLPYSFIYFLVSIFSIVSLLQIFHLIKGKLSLKTLGLRIINFFGALYTVFLFSWGLNYERPSVKEKLNIPDIQENALLYINEYNWVLSKAISKRNEIVNIDTNAIDFSFLSHSVEFEIKDDVQNAMHALGYRIIANPPVRKVDLNGFFRRMNIAGMYMPFTGEALVDATELPIKNIFTTAHELAHAYGIANEGEANFVALMACIQSSDPLVGYAGYYNYWRYVATKLRNFEPELYEAYHSNIPIGIRADRNAIIENSKLYPAIFPEASDFINDSYLKAQGVENGSNSYDDFTLLVLGYKMKINT